MRKLFLFGTALCVAGTISTNAWSFGGLGILGHKSSSHKGGVNAIGVHIDAENKEQPNIDIRSCDSETEELVGNECCKKTLIYTDNDTTKCCSTEGYAVQDGKCKKQCGFGWTLNEESNECECPEIRKCGDACCGEGNVCVDGNKCCHGYVEGDEGEEEISYDDGECCDASVSMGYSTWDGSCCEIDSILVSDGSSYGAVGCCLPGTTGFASGDGGCCPKGEINVDGHCCPAGSIGWTNGCCGPDDTQIFYDIKMDEPHCCPSNSTGYALEDGCCPSGTISDDFHCCPEGSTESDGGGWRCI